MANMDIDDVVDLSLSSSRESLTISPAFARDLRTLTQNSSLTITPAPPPVNAYDHIDDGRSSRRVLRPRTEPKSYAEAPDIVLLPAKVNGRQQQNGNVDSETDDEEMPTMIPIKELSPAEIRERERVLRKLREELRNEETKLVLLKKLKQSQHVMKENLIVTPANMSPTNPLAAIPAALTKGSLSVTPTTAVPLPAHSKSRPVPPISNNRTQSIPGRTNAVLPPPRSSLPGGATLTPGGPPLRNSSGLPRTGPNLTITPSVTITPTSAPPAGIKPRNVPGTTINNSVSITPAPPLSNSSESVIKNERLLSRDDGQTPAQRQAAAKLALRKQLEKTLLQIPPPKPPPPEMNFIPNPSNTEFVYLLGLEHVVDYLTTKDRKSSVLPPFRCAQCKIDFTPVWKWEKQGGKEPKVICEQCVTTNVKKALKAEHTNRLKTAFVKALQQEQEIEQRLAAQSSPSPVDSHPTTPVPQQPLPPPPQQPLPSAPQPQPQPPQHQPPSLPTQQQIHQQQLQQQQLQQMQQPLPTKSITPSPTPRPTPPPPSQPTPPPPPPAPRTPRHEQTPTPTPSFSISAPPPPSPFDKFPLNLGNIPNIHDLCNLGSLGNLGNLGSLANTNPAATVAAMQALHQQVFRILQQNPQMMQFTPLLYSYHLTMAHAQAAAGKNPPTLADIQRAAELQRYLLEMIPPQAPGPSNSRQNNWKT